MKSTDAVPSGSPFMGEPMGIVGSALLVVRARRVLCALRPFSQVMTASPGVTVTLAFGGST